MRGFPITVLFSLFVASVAGSGEPSPPQDVIAAGIAPFVAVVTWAPGDTSVDSYNVYGVDGSGGLHLVGSTLTNSFPVVGAYDDYAVTAVSGGVESSATYASALPCVMVRTSPPQAGLAECRSVGARIVLA